MSDPWFNLLFIFMVVLSVAVVGVGIYAVLYLLPHAAHALGG